MNLLELAIKNSVNIQDCQTKEQLEGAIKYFKLYKTRFNKAIKKDWFLTLYCEKIEKHIQSKKNLFLSKELTKDFIVECNVCGQRYVNHVGSTPCCGSIAYLVDENGKREEAVVFGGVGGKIEPIVI
jgi:hypothetical protein